MTDLKHVTNHSDEDTGREPRKDQDQGFEPPVITKLGKLTRVIKQSATGAVTIGAGVG